MFRIIIGVLVFIVFFSSPMWWNFVSGGEKLDPDPKLPTKYDECVKDAHYMKTSHMDLLNKWRDDVVREHDRYFKNEDGTYFEFDGKKAEKSLTMTCLGCHDSKADFCDQCHNYLAVTPYCWECHVTPEESEVIPPPDIDLNEEMKAFLGMQEDQSFEPIEDDEDEEEDDDENK